MSSIVKTTSVILGSIIGAGFASGQEIKIFFTNYGIYGLIGEIISILVIAFVLNLSLKTILKNNTNTYSKFLEIMFKDKKILSYSMRNIIVIFLLSGFFLMSIGFATCLEQQFSIPKPIGGVIIDEINYITFIGNIDRIIKINTYIMPILIILIVIAAVKVIVIR